MEIPTTRENSKSLPIVSIIIPTRDRERCLIPCLESLRSLSYQKDKIEIIVVNDGKGLSQDLETRFPEMRLINGTDHLGASRARNMGIIASRGEIVAFIDDDVVVHPEWLSNLVRIYQRSPGVSAIVGRITRKSFNEVETANVPVGAIGLNGHLYFNFDRAKPYRVEWMRGCNLSVRREVVREIGGFNEALGEITIAEDIEFSLRLKKHAMQMRYEPSVVLIHTEFRSGGIRTAPADLAFFATRNVVYVYLKSCDYPKKFAAIMRNVGGIVLLSIKRYQRSKHREGGIPDIIRNTVRGFVHGVALAWTIRDNESSFVRKDAMR